MLRIALPRQRHALLGIARRTKATNSTPPITPRPPAPEKRSEIPAPPVLPPDPSTTPPISSPSPNAPSGPTVPRVPTPEAPQTATTTPASNTPPPPPPPPATPPSPKPKRRRFRRFLLYSTSFLGLAYAGGVYYALVSDNFHDFFTEYIPFGEDAVLYFEEQEFKRRFPNRSIGQTPLYPQTSGENKVTVSGKSGVSARVTDDAEDESRKPDRLGKTDRAIAEPSRETKPTAKSGPPGQIPAKPAEPAKGPLKGEVPKQDPPRKEPPKKEVAAGDRLGKTDRAIATTTGGKPAETTPEPRRPAPAKALSGDGLGTTDRAVATTKDGKPIETTPVPQGSTPPLKAVEPRPQSKQTSAAPAPQPPATPASQIDALAIDNAADPVVQNVTKIVNDVIAVVNADDAAGKYSSTISKAKDDVKSLASEIGTYRAREALAADEKIRQSQVEFDQGAQDLIARIQKAERDQAISFREEYESERERLSKTYDDKLRAELANVRKIADQKLQNELLDQNKKLTDDFTSSVKDSVETERSGRLSRLNELAAQINKLETLTTQWGNMLDSNIKTQHLVVAVQAVRAALDRADRPTPFVHELVALKETANDSPLVNAAVASIHPSAYQKGVPTSAQLMDRFRRVATEVRKASLLPEDAGAASHAASRVLSKVMFKKQGMAIGEDVESVLTRAEMCLEEGNLDEAAREMNGLDGWAKVLSKDWLGDCRRVLEVRQAIDVIAAEARLQSLLVQ